MVTVLGCGGACGGSGGRNDLVDGIARSATVYILNAGRGGPRIANHLDQRLHPCVCSFFRSSTPPPSVRGHRRISLILPKSITHTTDT